MNKEMELVSCAKVNFGLRVLGRRPDGYHEVETLLQTVDLVDTVVLESLSRGVEVWCDHPAVPKGEDNLAYRAAQALQGRVGVEKGVRITIIKRIPVGAGLGGGSSNAASVLLGLNHLWGLHLSRKQLFSLAARLGVDVPFFLRGGLAYATGRGDRLRFLSWVPEVWLVLFCPGFAVSTAWAYQNLEKMALTRENKNISLSSVLKGSFQSLDLPQLLYNDFDLLVARDYPVIGEAKAELLSRGALGVAMSGSGPTVYGVFTEADSARRAWNGFKNREGESFLTRPVRPRGSPWDARRAIPGTPKSGR